MDYWANAASCACTMWQHWLSMVAIDDKNICSDGTKYFQGIAFLGDHITESHCGLNGALMDKAT